MINELNENKSFRSIDNSEVVSLRKKSDRELDLSSSNAPKKKRKKKEEDKTNKKEEEKKDEEKKESVNKESQTLLPSVNSLKI